MKGLGLYVGGIQSSLAPIDLTELDTLLEPIPRRQAPNITEPACARQRLTAELESNKCDYCEHRTPSPRGERGSSSGYTRPSDEHAEIYTQLRVR
ncbi:hypothetical protein SARC_07928 [Sphaeroforma arctica JP610]|uniref:Uncharacterized protein n=1 Tax=Sphaeroforma arctica JP610 TaxID=667725 RepID=A0A0L0FSY3_9EUKA|nr:hypothetical protein SARC_07928 [Sphaeroforma arctica JP610]KNC79681.1 hypothetical protein SARC_07928 [Sphaeroforma arctica JP610]|eukprot:XP_014153583.1 hypothetical protein SARC_07928 [Sphaeroforma arctica JP610]